MAVALGPIALLENFVKHTHALSARRRTSSSAGALAPRVFPHRVSLAFSARTRELQIAFEKSFSTSIELCELTGSLDECTRDDLTSINYHMRRLVARV